MTRINCVPPSELCNKHLTAEFYELPRVFSAVRRVLALDVDPALVPAPTEYTLGTGHVKFFYTRLGWLADRHAELILEMLSRRMKVNRENVKGLTTGIPKHLMNGWEPSEKDIAACRERIKTRLVEMRERQRRKLLGIKD